MKIRKTIIFMIQNPSPMFLYFLMSWLLFSSLSTISDDPFLYGTIPDATENIENWSSGLPWSIWKIFQAFSIMIEEIIRDISYENFWFVIIPTIIIGFLEARSSMIGISKEREDWIKWYDSISEEKQSSEGVQLPIKPEPKNHFSLYFKELRLHIMCWMAFFLFITLIIGYERRIHNPYFGFSQTIFEFSTIFSMFIIPAILLTLLSSYRASRGITIGVSTERNSWMDWYKQHRNAENYSIEKPPSESVQVESIFSRVLEPVIFILRNPSQLYKQFLVWGIVIPILFFLLCIIIWGIGDLSLDRALLDMFVTLTIPLCIIAYIMSYRDAKGKITGIRLEQSFWNNWYNNIQIKTDYFRKHVNNSDPSIEETFFFTISLTLEFMFERPIRFIYHILGWIVCFVVIYGITDWVFLEGFSDAIQVLLILSLAIISYYYETKGYLIGCMNQRRYWIDWLNQKPENEEGDSESHDTPGLLEVC